MGMPDSFITKKPAMKNGNRCFLPMNVAHSTRPKPGSTPPTTDSAFMIQAGITSMMAAVPVLTPTMMAVTMGTRMMNCTAQGPSVLQMVMPLKFSFSA